jgi:hypothetical protein
MIREKYPAFYNALMNYNSATCAEAFNEWEEELPAVQKEALKALEQELDKISQRELIEEAREILDHIKITKQGDFRVRSLDEPLEVLVELYDHLGMERC